MKKTISFILTIFILCAVFTGCGEDNRENTSQTSTAKQTEESTTDTAAIAAFTGTVDEILDAIISGTDSEELAGIVAYHSYIDEGEYGPVLGLTDAEYAQYVESAVEHKPDNSWVTHSVVVVRVKDGENVAAVAEKVCFGTSPSRFGCLRVDTIVVAYTGQYIILIASFGTITENIYGTVTGLSKLTVNRIDRPNDWGHAR